MKYKQGKFKVGDRVRCVKNVSEFYRKIGKVKFYDSRDMTLPYGVVYDCNCSFWHAENELELGDREKKTQ